MFAYANNNFAIYTYTTLIRWDKYRKSCVHFEQIYVMTKSYANDEFFLYYQSYKLRIYQIKSGKSQPENKEIE